MRVPLYQATVNDAATKKISEYAVTRDALWSTRAGGSHIFVNNSAFEPKDDVGRYQGMIVDYPSNSGLQAVLLLNSKGTNKLSTSNDRITPPTEGASKGFATSVMIHVGGEYQRSDNKTYITGSFGCFGVYKKNGDNLVGGNEAINAFIEDVQNRQNANKDKSLHVNVNQRDSVRWNEVVKKVKK